MEWFVELTTVFINIRIGYQGSGEDGRSGGKKGFGPLSAGCTTTLDTFLHGAREGCICTVVDCMLNNHSCLFFLPGEVWIPWSKKCIERTEHKRGEMSPFFLTAWSSSDLNANK